MCSSSLRQRNYVHVHSLNTLGGGWCCDLMMVTPDKQLPMRQVHRKVQTNQTGGLMIWSVEGQAFTTMRTAKGLE